MTRSRTLPARLLALLFVVGLVASACSSSSDEGGAPPDRDDETQDDGGQDGEDAEFIPITGVPGVTDAEIRFAALGTATAKNPTGACYLECFASGVRAYFAYRNSEGGVHGRQLVLADPIDDDLGGAQQKALEVVSADNALGVFMAPIIPAGYEAFTEAGVPVYTYLTAPDQGARTNLFGSPPPSCVDCTRIDQVFMAEAIGAERVAAIGYSVQSSATCAGAVTDSFQRYAGDVDARVVYENVSLAFGLPNGIGPEVTAMKNAGVQIVYACLDQNGAKALGEELRRQGLDIPFVQNESYDTEFIGANAAAYENAIMLTSVRPSEAVAEGTDRALFETWMDEIGATSRPGISAHGWILARLAYEGLVAAGPEFDRQALIDGTNSIEDYTSGGLLAVPWDVGRQHQIPTEDDQVTHGWVPYCFVIMQISGGQGSFMEPASAEKPSLCWESRNPDYAQPEPTDIR